MAKRLRARRGEIQQSLTTRIHAIADPSETPDLGYVEGLRAAIVAALEYGFLAAETTGRREPPIPLQLLVQARAAARAGVSLDTVLRRYFAGYSLLGHVLMEEAGRDGLMSGAELQRLLASQAGLFDRLLAAVADEHERESGTEAFSPEQRDGERIERLLAGELLDASDIAYDFSAWHLGISATDPCALDGLRELSRSLGLRFLVGPCTGASTVCAWLGGSDPLDSTAIVKALDEMPGWSDRVALALGEPGEGLVGWRLTHRQATAALPFARQGPGAVVRYADVAFVAAALHDDALAAFLRDRVLGPLEVDRNDGSVAKETLRAYLAAGQNVSSTAAALGVKRHTVTRRLRIIEDRIDRPISRFATEIDIALRLDRHDRQIVDQFA